VQWRVFARDFGFQIDEGHFSQSHHRFCDIESRETLTFLCKGCFFLAVLSVDRVLMFSKSIKVTFTLSLSFLASFVDSVLGIPLVPAVPEVLRRAFHGRLRFRGLICFFARAIDAA